ncbi:MAG: hypothetical protein ACPKNR_00830 [Pleomorphochaeta sp.]
MKFLKRIYNYYNSKEYKEIRKIALKVHGQIRYSTGIHYMFFF